MAEKIESLCDNKCALILGDCVNEMQELINKGYRVDLTITSPPYDEIYSYGDTLVWSFDIFKEIARLLYEITNDGGVVVWVVNDQMVKGSETGTSFKQALYFMEVGFKLHDTMIYAKNNPVPNAKTRYQQSFEYMFVFSKGKPKTTNILTEPRSNKWNDKRCFRKEKRFNRDKTGDFTVKKDFHFDINEEVPRRNIWYYSVGLNGSTKDREAFKHPAIFPEKLVQDHILSWSNENDVVFDPFTGSGTTGKMAMLNNRKFIGIEKVEIYFDIANKRISEAIENNEWKDVPLIKEK